MKTKNKTPNPIAMKNNQTNSGYGVDLEINVTEPNHSEHNQNTVGIGDILNQDSVKPSVKKYNHVLLGENAIENKVGEAQMNLDNHFRKGDPDSLESIDIPSLISNIAKMLEKKPRQRKQKSMTAKDTNTMETKCERCLVLPSTHIHHKDHNHENNNPSNLMNLCVSCHEKEHGNVFNNTQIRRIMNEFNSIQSIRVNIAGVVRSLTQRGVEIPDSINMLLSLIVLAEKNTTKKMKNYWEPVTDIQRNRDTHTTLETDHRLPLYSWLLSINGVGEILASKILQYISLDKIKSCGGLRTYAGYGDAKMQKRTKRQKINFNKKFKTTLYNLTDSWLKSYRSKKGQCKYVDIFRKEWAKQKWALDRSKRFNPNFDKKVENGMRAILRARRIAIKTFLKDFYNEIKKCQSPPFFSITT